MQPALDQFAENIKRVRNLGAVHTAVDQQTTSVVDISDMLRAQIVLIVSALDTYVHEIVRLGMTATLQGNRNASPAYLKFEIEIADAMSWLRTPAHSAWLDDAIRRKHSIRSFQNPDNVADALRLIFPDPLWPAVGNVVGQTPEAIRLTLKTIVDRRNKIAHEADLDPTYPFQRWPISPVLVEDAVDFIDKIVHGIHVVVT